MKKHPRYKKVTVVTLIRDPNYASSKIVAQLTDEKSIGQFLTTLLAMPRVKRTGFATSEEEDRGFFSGRSIMRELKDEPSSLTIQASDGKQAYNFYEDGEGNIRQSGVDSEREQEWIDYSDNGDEEPNEERDLLHIYDIIMDMFLHSKSPELNYIERQKAQSVLVSTMGKDVAAITGNLAF